MNKRSIILFGFIFLMGALLAIVNTLYRKQNRLKKELMIIRDKDSISRRNVEDLLLTHAYCIDLKLRGNFILSDADDNSIKLGDVINKKKYIYHFDETNCLSCVEKFLPFLKKLSDKIGRENVAIFGSYENPRHLFLTLQNYETHGIAAYNLAPSYLKSEKISEINVPYIFMIDSAMAVSKVYIPEKGLPEISDLYLSHVSKIN